MRLLVTIPHFCRREGPPGVYGSESGNIPARVAQVSRCLAALHQTFGPRQALIGATLNPANTTSAGALDVALVTTGDQHLADELPRHLFVRFATTADPRHLGFLCHELMREHAARYDYFAYLEDDIEITDGLFFHKLTWFSQTFGPHTLLQPNRFERAHDLDVMKLYIDGPTTAPDIPARFQDKTVNPRLLGEAFGRSFLFERVDNVHAGAFFLTAPQLARAAQSPHFGKPSAAFFGPLETAATLAVMTTFDVYKPARENAAFLEAHHLGRRFLFPAPGQPGTQPTTAPPTPDPTGAPA